MPQIGCNIYFWGWAEQSRLLVECLGPLAAGLRDEGLARGVWFDRFDARGPHLFALVTAASPAAGGEVARRLSGRLGEYLAARPSAAPMTPEEVAALHAQTRGKALCAADTQPGLAGNNSCVLFEHPPGGYPFPILAAGRSPEEEDEIWGLLSDLAAWGIARLAASPAAIPMGVAALWLAGLDRELRRLGVAEGYWRYHATTLLLGLEERLADDERSAIASLPAAVGLKNFETFSRVWRDAEPRPPAWAPLPRLAGLLLAGGEATAVRRFAALREAVHCFLKQLGVPVSMHIPLVLFAWHQGARSREAVPS
jgi:hypothetical protein